MEIQVSDEIITLALRVKSISSKMDAIIFQEDDSVVRKEWSALYDERQEVAAKIGRMLAAEINFRVDDEISGGCCL